MKTGMYYENGSEIRIGHRVHFLSNIGEIVFENGAFGIGFERVIDYDEIQKEMDESEWCCGNTYHGCMNDNFLSLWEIYWNFNCEQNTIEQITEVGECENCPLGWEERGYEGECYDCGCMVKEDTEWCEKSYAERLEKSKEFES